jgi:membrane protein required for colicin V production
MNGFDVLIVLVLLIFATLGAWRGFVREALSLVTWAVAGVLALLFADRAADLSPGFVKDPALRLALGFLVLFIALFLAGMAGAWWLDRLLARQRAFQLFNRIAGTAFGAARGAFLIVIAFLLAGLTELPQRPWWREAAVAPVFVKMALAVKDYLPRDVARHIRYG